jgi:hypothetical protein
MDASDAWPDRQHLHLDGFSFNHLGGFEGETGPEMRARGMKWWDSWARRDPDYSPAPYAQLAAALTSAGDRDAANEIRYLGRVRERETEKGLAYIWSGAVQYVAGFGIGTYTFRVLWWVLGFSFAGSRALVDCPGGSHLGRDQLRDCSGASVPACRDCCQRSRSTRNLLSSSTIPDVSGSIGCKASYSRLLR